MIRPSVARSLALSSLLLVNAIAGCARCGVMLDEDLGERCAYPDGPCASGSVCAFPAQGQASRCVSFVEDARPMRIPFPPGAAFSCFQGPRSAVGRSHSFAGDIFAIDLVSKPPGAPRDVVAPIDGEAFVYDGCEERANGPDAHNSSSCGLGYGNHVKISDGRRLALLAHLSRVKIAPGRVRAGDVVGVEGVSGAAGPRHVHLTVSDLSADGDAKVRAQTPGWRGSLPLRPRFDVRPEGGSREVRLAADELGCDESMKRTWIVP